jgi:hypothetical protein
MATGVGLSWLTRCTAVALLLLTWSLAAATARAADPTDSILTYGCDPPLPRSSANCAIWHTSPVNLRWTLVDPNFTPVPGSNCDTTLVDQDTQGTDITCAVRDAALTEVQKTVRMRVDQTAPAVTGAAPGRAADQAGWWNHPVQWVFAGSDATSGLAGCDAVTYSGPDSANGDVAGACLDVAGNSATGHAAIKYDATPPEVTGATPERGADRNGWWNHAVKWLFAGSDATSGLAGCDSVTYSGPDSGSGDVAGDCRDLAGNAITGHQAIKYDDVPPALTGATPSRPPDHAGWWTRPVTIAFAGTDSTSGIAGCDSISYTGPDDPAFDFAGGCRDIAGNGANGHTTIKYDATPPKIDSPTTARPADNKGWWNHPVSIVFTGSDATSGIASCDTIAYSGPDGPAAHVTGTCVNGAGNSASADTQIKYDATPPTVTSVTPERPPDHDGWWNHPVKVAFAGSDATSGLDFCDTIVYSGAAEPSADVTGNCQDSAGNIATGRLGMKYDGDPPALSALPPEVGSNEVVLHWTTSPDTVLTEVTRSPGIGGAPASTVYSGNGETFSDPGVKNGVTYTYSIRASDAAANLASTTVTVTPRADPVPQPDAARNPTPDTAPAPTAAPTRTAGTKRPEQPPRLKWRRVKGASYYNVQLYRGTKKILSLWPTSTQVQLGLRWRFQGQLMRLTPARYDWYVWPGFGKRARHRYGRLIAHRHFTFGLGDAVAPTL